MRLEILLFSVLSDFFFYSCVIRLQRKWRLVCMEIRSEDTCAVHVSLFLFFFCLGGGLVRASLAWMNVHVHEGVWVCVYVLYHSCLSELYCDWPQLPLSHVPLPSLCYCCPNLSVAHTMLQCHAVSVYFPGKCVITGNRNRRESAEEPADKPTILSATYPRHPSIVFGGGERTVLPFLLRLF